ncbi:hypothetical protein BCON_0347g00070 [Botryotinia convoluta]|uniref:Uncharacterized protein n=1 Tax=Botryotinia convoluta TaxID=54673 RepID=A0A4Z1HCM1_9HELO|nr:hypothetical protein BCON_0347g00070 [Botryotinia convoluta]
MRVIHRTTGSVTPPTLTIPSIYRGIADHYTVSLVTIGAACYSTPLTTSPAKGMPQQIAIHSYGGGYVLSSYRSVDSGWKPGVLFKHLKLSVLQIQYRLVVEKIACFTAVLQDGLTAYSYVHNDSMFDSKILFYLANLQVLKFS